MRLPLHRDGGALMETPAIVIDLGAFRVASLEARRELVKSLPSDVYRPIEGEELHRDVARIDTEVFTLAALLRFGHIKPAAAAAVLELVHNDLKKTFGRALTLERKLAKAKRKLKRR